MNEEKMYAVKNDEGKYWDFNDLDGFWELIRVSCPITVSEENAKNEAKAHGGHVVTLIEEPEKVVLTKEQAKIVEEAHRFYLPAILISQKSGNEGEEELLMNAYVNGYTVASEKKYNVKVPHAEDIWYYKGWDGKLETTCQVVDKIRITFTEAEIEHYGLQDCEKVECDNDEQ